MKKVILTIISLLMLGIIFISLFKPVPENALLITHNGDKIIVKNNELDFYWFDKIYQGNTDVESFHITGYVVSLRDLLNQRLRYDGYTKVRIYSEDNSFVDVKKDIELKDNNVFLMHENDDSINLVVFTDRYYDCRLKGINKIEVLISDN